MFDGGADGIVKFQVNGQDVAGTTYTFDPSTGVGSYDFTVTAIDADGDQATNSFHVTVESSNTPPLADDVLTETTAGGLPADVAAILAGVRGFDPDAVLAFKALTIDGQIRTEEDK